MNVEVTVDEGYHDLEGISFLRIYAVEDSGRFERRTHALRSASPDGISESFMENAYILEEDPPEEFDGDDCERLKALIEFYREAAMNVPGLREY